jgi:hypothetical protein
LLGADGFSGSSSFFSSTIGSFTGLAGFGLDVDVDGIIFEVILLHELEHEVLFAPW